MTGIKLHILYGIKILYSDYEREHNTKWKHLSTKKVRRKLKSLLNKTIKYE